VVSRAFEGLEIPKGLDKNVIHEMEGMNKRSQLSKYTADGKRVWSTQMFERPVNIMDAIVKHSSIDSKQSLFQLANQEQQQSGSRPHRIDFPSYESLSDLPKYMMYSSHDTQLAIAW